MELRELSIRNPVLGFRLDPGEPGMLRSGKATEATLLVTGQEHRNLMRLESDARMNGRVIVYSGIKFGRAFRGAFLTTTNGMTTVVSRAPRPTIVETAAAYSNATDNDDPELTAPQPSAPSPPPSEPAPAGDSGRVLDGAENALRAELRRLETPELGEPTGPVVGIDPGERGANAMRTLEDSSSRRAEASRQQRKNEVESQLRRIEAGRLMARLAGALAPAAPAPALEGG